MSSPQAKSRAVFMDRDGVINREVNYLCRSQDLRLLPGVARSIRRLNRAGWLAIVVTNQSAVARGMCSVRDVEAVHEILRKRLRRHGARLDAIYYCPHHPGPAEHTWNPAFVRRCGCRKPKTGMIRQARRDFAIAMESSFMVGDKPSDIVCGRRAGLSTIAVRSGHPWTSDDAHPDYAARDLAEAVRIILGRVGKRQLRS